nr:AAA family ATPase [Micromonospora sp. DSM 115978]
MLRSFRVANHRSVRDEQELSFDPWYDRSRPVVPVAAVFGANAAGKSNLLDALWWMRSAVLDSFAAWQPGSGVPRTRFRLDPATEDRPSVFAVELVLDGVRHGYGFETDSERIRQEWLYTYPRNRRRVVFERDDDVVRLGSTVVDSRGRAEVLAELTRPNALLLSVAARLGLAEAVPAYRWFQGVVFLLDGVAPDAARGVVDRLAAAGAARRSIVELVRAADLGIHDVVVRRSVTDEELRELRAELAAAEAAAEAARSLVARVRAAPDGDAGRLAELLTLAEREVELAELVRRRAAVAVRQAQVTRDEPPRLLFRQGGGGVALELVDQSAGTRTWLSLLGTALEVVRAGTLLVVDELDRSLHPHLAAKLVNLFRDPRTNPGGAQLWFTTHDATLLDEEVLARDEVWFVDKDGASGASRLYPLTDFHPRRGENTRGRYLAGSYGAVPVLVEGAFRDAVSAPRDAGDPGGDSDAA